MGATCANLGDSVAVLLVGRLSGRFPGKSTVVPNARRSDTPYSATLPQALGMLEDGRHVCQLERQRRRVACRSTQWSISR